jgi:uncharacterized protein (DUF2267 family)
MTVQSIDSIERSVHKTHEWLADLTEEMGAGDREDAWRWLRAYLQVLRDRLTVEEEAQLAAQLPHLLRGVFYDGFDPTRVPEKIRDRDTFLAILAERAQLDDTAEAARLAAAATRVLRRHVTEGEIDDVMSQLPAEIREALEQG